MTGSIHRCRTVTTRVAALVGVLITLAVSSWPARAQAGKSGQVELGLYGLESRYDPTGVGLKTNTGAGGRLGFFMSSVFSLQGHGDYTRTELSLTGNNVSLVSVGGTLLAHARVIGAAAFYVGAGYEKLFYRGAYQFNDQGAHAILGTRLPLGARAALRFEAKGVYLPTARTPGVTGSALNFSGSAGISIYSFGGPGKDTDRDHVADKRDTCPETPLGAKVDPAGCPLDGDKDTVPDGLDQCPDTPAGAKVDPNGCPIDSDKDNVFDGLDSCPETPSGATVGSDGCPIDTDSDKVFDGIDQCADTPAGATVDSVGCPIDTDGDKVFDGIDQCPDSPAGVSVDARGCPADTDGDGVPNITDKCPDTPANTRVDEAGCPSDSDNDGVLNAVDRCPATPAGAKVDPTGCPIDRDADGVENALDRCPNTLAGQKVDAVGCPVLFEVVEGKARALVLRGVTFQTASSALTPASYTVLDEVAGSLVGNPTVRIEIAGHTDSTGTRVRNVQLSLARALAVRAYLARKGVAPSRMVARGYGPDRPVAPNATTAGRLQNRRVELSPIP